METFDREVLKVWIWRLAVVTALSVGVLSWLGGVPLLILVLRMGLAFALMYGLSVVGLVLFEQGGAQVEAAPDGERGKGSLIDIAVGEYATTQSEDRANGNVLAGQDADAGSEARLKAERGPEASHKQGPLEGLPGQVQPGLQRGLPDTETQADMVRRMGWGDLNDT